MQDLPFAAMLARCYSCIASELLSTLEEHQATHSKCYEEIVAGISYMQANENAIRAADRAASGSHLIAANGPPNLHAPAAAEPTIAQIADALLDAARTKLLEHAKAEAEAQPRGSSEPVRLSLELKDTRETCGSTTSKSASAAPTDAVRRLALPAAGTVTWQVLKPHRKLEQLCMRLVVAQVHRQSSLVVAAQASVAEYLMALLATFAEEQLFELGKVASITSSLPSSQVRPRFPVSSRSS